MSFYHYINLITLYTLVDFLTFRLKTTYARPITTNVVSSNPAQRWLTQYNIMW